MRVYLAPKVLVIDEVGYLPLDDLGATIFFQLVSARYERGSIILTRQVLARDTSSSQCELVLLVVSRKAEAYDASAGDPNRKFRFGGLLFSQCLRPPARRHPVADDCPIFVTVLVCDFFWFSPAPRPAFSAVRFWEPSPTNETPKLWGQSTFICVWPTDPHSVPRRASAFFRLMDPRLRKIA